MKVRRITASNMQKALRKVSEEMGADAVILSNRKVDGGVEIVAAEDYPNSSEQVATSSNTSNKNQPKPSIKQSFDVQNAEREVNRQLELQDTLAAWKHAQTDANKSQSKIKKTAARTPQNLIASNNETLQSIISRNDLSAKKRSNSQKTMGSENTFASMKAELDQLEKMLAADANQAAWTPSLMHTDFQDVDIGIAQIPMDQPKVTRRESTARMLPAWSHYSPCNLVQAELWDRWKRTGLEDWLCFDITSDIQGFENQKQAWKKGVDRIQAKIPIAKETWMEGGGVLAIVGPTGAGKTTTTCKLAVEKVLSQGANSVALVTTDNYRIAAHGQLLTLGRILGIRVKTLQAGQSIKECLQELREYPSILIDTAGLTAHDPDLSMQMDLLQQSRSEFDVMLALPGTSQGRCLRRLIDLYRPLNPSACVLTKLDEADAMGEVLSVVIEQKMPIAFVSQGQRIPDDLKPASAQLLLEETLKRADLEWPLEEAVEEKRSAQEPNVPDTSASSDQQQAIQSTFRSSSQLDVTLPMQQQLQFDGSSSTTS